MKNILEMNNKNKFQENTINSLIDKLLCDKIHVKKYDRIVPSFNTKTINPTLTVAESGLINNSIIHVIITKGIEGAKILFLIKNLNK